MESIKLTKEQRDKLLEMCVLFDYDYIKYEESEDGFANNFIMFYNEDEPKSTSIHWFEFCLTHLQEKIRKSLDEPIDAWNNKLIGKLSFYFNNKTINHPIDYLYDKFKEIK